MWPTGRGNSAALLLAMALGAAAAVPVRQRGVFRATTQTVPVFTTVTGPDGRLVTDLTRGDFEIYDDGRPMPITTFGNDVQPISIVTMLDTSGSMTGNIRLIRDASVQLFTHLLPADKARVGNFGDRITVSPRFTNDANELIRWLWTEVEPGGPTPLWGAINVGMTALQRVDGRRVVLVFTDGHDASSREFVTQRDVIQRAQTEEFMIYGIGLYSRGGGSFGYARGRPLGSAQGRRGGYTDAPDPGLKSLADETGGGYFELVDATELGPTFARVADELHRQYLLAFTADRLDGKLHKIDVRVRREGMSARARRSYVAQSEGTR